MHSACMNTTRRSDDMIKRHKCHLPRFQLQMYKTIQSTDKEKYTRHPTKLKSFEFK